MEGIGKRGWMGGIVILARCEFYFTREHGNLVKHPSNDKSIVITIIFIPRPIFVYQNMTVRLLKKSITCLI